MLFLYSHHIADLYAWVDDLVPKGAPHAGRPPALSDPEVLAILIWHSIVLKQKTLKDMYEATRLYHHVDFPRLPSYSAFVSSCHRALPQMFRLLSLLLSDEEAIRIMDSTMLPVCRIHRADSHKVAQGMAQFGKNWQGWHFGFKLHASISLEGRLSQIAFSGSNTYDAQMMHLILNEHARIAVGDTLYGAKAMGERIKRRYGTVIISPPFPKQNKKIAAPWQTALLNARSKIESVFDYLKEHLHLVSSFPRSVGGYVLHYVRVLLGYQTAMISRTVAAW